MRHGSRIVIVVSALAILAVLALDYAAVDDITTGHEPSLNLEWLVLAASVPVLALLALVTARATRRRPG